MIAINARNSSYNDQKNGDRSKLDRRRLNARREVALVMVTGNVFQTLISETKLLQFY